MRRILHIIRKEFIQIRRDRAIRALILMVPIIQIWVLGYVISSEVKQVSTVICDLDRTSTSRALIERLSHTVYLNVRYHEESESLVGEYLDTGRAMIAVVLPSGLEKNLQTLQPSRIQLLVDGQDANTANVALGHIAGILESYLTDRVRSQSAAALLSEEIHLLTPVVQVWYNPNLKLSDFMIPGIVVFLLTMITTLVSAMGLVREREIGTLEQLLVAPIKKHELLIGKIIPFALLGLVEMGLAIGFARLWYQIPIVGNLGLYLLLSVIFLFTTLGLGLLVSAFSHTQQQAMFMSWFILIFILLMSGFLFPIENMPRSAQWLTYLNPMRYFILITRELFIKGAGLRHLYVQGLILCLFGALIFTFSVLRFQKRLT
ncbi:MAG: Inner membrane transport permease YbhR [bacterium ADurb.Bin478]|nr:MAG: Inner membrane transport permease YbhR [bacterium ADurb.Bin478]